MAKKSKGRGKLKGPDYLQCDECGRYYYGIYAEIFYKNKDKKEKLRLRGRCVCDECFEEIGLRKGYHIQRTKKI